MKKTLLACSLIFSAVVACKKGSELLPGLFKGFQSPTHFPAPTYDLSSNPVTEAGFELGKKLFNEPRLSRDNTISCGSCHIQSAGFTHHGHDVSHGIDDRLGIRNPMPIMNLAWSSSFFWDGGVFNLDFLSVVPIENPLEMDETMPNVLAKLRAHPAYPALFEKAFGSTEITSAKLSKALSQFMVTAVSANSKFDSVMRKEAHVSFTKEEQRGFEIYQQHCSSCHTAPLFTDFSFRDNGIGPNPVNDKGRSEITLADDDRYKFKVPSLRNLKYTAPYMHDGRFYTLAAVLDHYTKEMEDTENLDPVLRKKQGAPGIPLTELERSDLLAFLNTLNDISFVKDPLFAE